MTSPRQSRGTGSTSRSTPQSPDSETLRAAGQLEGVGVQRRASAGTSSLILARSKKAAGPAPPASASPMSHCEPLVLAATLWCFCCLAWGWACATIHWQCLLLASLSSRQAAPSPRMPPELQGPSARTALLAFIAICSYIFFSLLSDMQ